MFDPLRSCCKEVTTNEEKKQQNEAPNPEKNRNS